MFQLVSPNINFDFVGKAKYFVTLSVVLLAVCFYGIFAKGFHFGVDFTGGTVVQVKFSEPKSAEDVRAIVNELGAEGATVVALGENSTEYMITVQTATEGEKKSPIAEGIVGKLGADKVSIEKVDVVGPKVGEELKWSAVKALVYSIILIMIYIWFRFDFRFAPGATIAMMHDLVFMLGFFVFTGHEFTITSVAALLTIAGYSVNDTIVIYDRARELLKAGGDSLPLGPTINKALNQTLSRTLITTLSTLLAIVGLLYFTTGEIQDFAVSMVIGLIAGTYSTLYIAVPFTLFVERLAVAKAARR